MKFANLARTATSLVAGASLFAAVSAGANAGGNTFNVSTTIASSCSVTDSGPADLTPTYDPTTDSGTGSETVLNTDCNGTTPSVTFTDPEDLGTNDFVMASGPNILYFQISTGASCTGIPGDNPIYEHNPVSLQPGPYALDICAAVITGGGVNTSAVAGSYSDTVTYSIAP
jgi:hypothetical protein